MNKLQRNQSFGQLKITLVDRFGVYLSERMVNKYLSRCERKKDINVLDLGCGYNAKLLRKIAPSITKGFGVDVAIDHTVKKVPNLKIYELPIEDSFENFEENYFDVVLMISVLEHLWDPLFVMEECFRILKNKGVLIINVPTWLGKYFLEFSAFKLKLSPPIEMDDHKMYYSKRDLWPLLVRSGFKPSSIKLTYHKFGLNLYSISEKN